jgi:hypothetical protein
MCTHRSSCPAAGSPAARPASAHVVAAHPEQGWNLLCDGRVVGPRRVPAGRLAMAA